MTASKLQGGLRTDPRHRRRIAELAERLSVYRARYYAGQPVVSDAAYDALEDELRRLDPTHPLLARVGSAELVKGWQKARHQIPMGSLNKVVAEQELRDWVVRCDELLAKQDQPGIGDDLFVAEKLDGISIEVLYRDGLYRDAITRGDGRVGERISANVARMRGVPHRIPERRPLSVRGEIILRLSDMREHFPDAVSARNAAAGTARRFDGQGCQHLTVLFYDIAEELAVSTELAKAELLRQLGLATPQTLHGTLADVIASYREYTETHRAALDYEIDGLVVTANARDAQRRLGEVHRRPRGAVAFKFASPSRVTRVLDVRWETGPSGRVTPVAEVEPVELAGATVRRASLHTAARVRALGLGIGDEVLVSRRNDVIPYVEEVVEKRGADAAPPELCGRCAEPLRAEGEYLVCRNRACSALVEGRIRNWIRAVDALEWGDKLIAQVVAKGLVREPADLYSLTEDQVASLEHQGPISAPKALDSLRSRLPLGLPVFLAALGIEGFGPQTARLLVAAGYDELAKLRAAGEQELAAIAGLGEIKAAAIVRGLAERGAEIDRLLGKDLGPVSAAETGSLRGKSFCFTGKHGRSRKELGQLVERHGGQVLSAVSQQLDFLVIADPRSSSSKAQKARRYGTRLIDEAELMELVARADDDGA